MTPAVRKIMENVETDPSLRARPVRHPENKEPFLPLFRHWRPLRQPSPCDTPLTCR
jgi:hypothetical protein